MNTLKFSHEHHIHLSQERILILIKQYWALEGHEDFLIEPVQEKPLAVQKLVNANEGYERVRFLVSPEDEEGWSVVWSEEDHFDDEVVSFLSYEGQCEALYGHRDDGDKSWRWMVFQNGGRQGEMWYRGGAQHDWVWLGKYPPRGEMLLSDAFASFGRKYHHFTWSDVLYGGFQEMGEPLSKFRVISSIPDHPS